MRREFVTASVIAMLVLAGCGRELKMPTRICPGKASVSDSLSSLRSQSENAVPLRANGKCLLRYYDESGKGHKENFSVKVWVNPPIEIYLQGDVAFDPKGIVLGSNEREFWLAIKPKEISTYWWGEWAEQDSFDEIPVHPKILLEVIGIAEVDGGENWSLSNEGAFDVLTERNDKNAIVKKTYIYSCDCLVRRIEYFGSDNEAVAVAELYKYKEVSRGFSVPTVIKIVKRAEDKKEDSVRITLDSVERANFTEEARSRIFAPPEPGGFKRVEKL